MKKVYIMHIQDYVDMLQTFAVTGMCEDIIEYLSYTMSRTTDPTKFVEVEITFYDKAEERVCYDLVMAEIAYRV